MTTYLRRALSCALTATAVLATVPAAYAHESRAVGALRVTVGWADEPAFAGFRNAAQVEVMRATGEDDEGTPVTNAKLKVEVLFGDAKATEKTEPLDLRPAFGSPGEYQASLVPTRPGTYTFHVFGTIGRTSFDQTFTSSDDTFNDVRNPTEVEFPAKDPSRGELAQKLTTHDTQIAALSEDADGVSGTASLALYIAIAGLVLGLAALALVMRSRPRT